MGYRVFIELQDRRDTHVFMSRDAASSGTLAGFVSEVPASRAQPHNKGWVGL